MDFIMHMDHSFSWPQQRLQEVILLLRFDNLHCIRRLAPTQALHGQQYQSFSLAQILHAAHQEKTQNFIADFRDFSVVSYLELNNVFGVISGNCVYL